MIASGLVTASVPDPVFTNPDEPESVAVIVPVTPAATSMAGRDPPEGNAIVPPVSRYPADWNASPAAPTCPDTVTVPADPLNTARDMATDDIRPVPLTHRMPTVFHVPLPPIAVPEAAADHDT